MMKIDFVIPWVNGNDPAWRAQFSAYRALEGLEDASLARFRDWDNLHYWFRGVETFAPWVDKIHLITWGHLPKWLNKEHPKLHIVNHEDIIERRHLPLFNINPIEISLHKIEGLAQHFVYFNDDTFLTGPVKQRRFFRHGLPCDTARLAPIAPSSIAHIIMNDVQLINLRHKKRMVPHLCKWFNLRYSPSDLFKTLTLAPWSSWTGFKDVHLPHPFLRQTFEMLWEQEGDKLSTTLNNRFRSLLDYNQYLFRYEQLVTGRFAPVGYGDARVELLDEGNVTRVAKALKSRRYSMMCLNDNNDISDFERVRDTLNEAFEELLPKKSSYEL